MNIIRDTREKYGWDFEAYPEIKVISKKLKAGDYTLEGCESKIIIERKASASEIATNLGKDYDRFCREFAAVSSLCKKYIICEFDYNELLIFPKGSKIPEAQLHRVKVSGNFLKYRASQLEEKYHVQFIFAGSRNNAEAEAVKILGEYNETENEGF